MLLFLVWFVFWCIRWWLMIIGIGNGIFWGYMIGKGIWWIIKCGGEGIGIGIGWGGVGIGNGIFLIFGGYWI